MSRYDLSQQFKSVTPTASTTAINTSSSWAALSGFVASFTDITLERVRANDVVVAYVAGSWADEAFDGDLAVATVIGGSTITNYLTSGTATGQACRPWRGRASVFTDFGAFSPPYVVQFADIEDDWNVTFRVMVNTTGSKTFHHDHPWSVMNLGPAQPGTWT